MPPKKESLDKKNMPSKKGKKKTNKMKKPPNSYFCFSQIMRPQIVCDNIIETSKALGTMWKNLKDEEKQIYKDLAQKALDIHKNKQNEIQKNRKKRPLSAYNEFVKNELANIKSKNPGIKHKVAFAEVASQWSAAKAAANKWKETANIN